MTAHSLPASSPSAARGIVLILLAVLGWVAMDTIGKHLVQVGHPVWQVTWARYAFHLMVMLPLLARGRLTVRSTRPVLQLLRSGLLLIVTFLVYTALVFLPLATVNAIGFLAPLLITALSVPLLGEQVGWRRWTAVVVGFVGVLILIRPGAGMDPALLIPVGVALCNALYQIATRILARHDSSMTTLFWTAIGGFVISTLLLPFHWKQPDLAGWGMMIVLGALGCLSHLAMIQAFARAPAAVIAPFVYTQLVWVIPVGYLVFGDLPDAWTLIGASVIVGSGLYVWYRETRRGAAQ